MWGDPLVPAPPPAGPAPGFASGTVALASVLPTASAGTPMARVLRN